MGQFLLWGEDIHIFKIDQLSWKRSPNNEMVIITELNKYFLTKNREKQEKFWLLYFEKLLIGKLTN